MLSSRGWQTKLKPYCLLQHVTMKSYGWMVPACRPFYGQICLKGRTPLLHITTQWASSMFLENFSKTNSIWLALLIPVLLTYSITVFLVIYDLPFLVHPYKNHLSFTKVMTTMNCKVLAAFVNIFNIHWENHRHLIEGDWESKSWLSSSNSLKVKLTSKLFKRGVAYPRYLQTSRP